jgi:hypothetical protein
VDHAPPALRHAEAVAKKQQERPVAHQRAAARALVGLAVEAGESPQLLSTAWALDARARARHSGDAEEQAPESLFVPRRDRSFQRRN